MAGKMEHPCYKTHRRDVHEQAHSVTADLWRSVIQTWRQILLSLRARQLKIIQSIMWAIGWWTWAQSNRHMMEYVETSPWREQLTLRAFVVSATLGVIFCILVHRLTLTVGIIPSLNVAAGLLGFFAVKSYITIAEKFGSKSNPSLGKKTLLFRLVLSYHLLFSCLVISCYGLAFSGGFGSYLLGMSTFAYEKLGADTPGNNLADVKDPSLSWIFPYILVTCLLVIFVLVPLCKVFASTVRLSQKNVWKF